MHGVARQGEALPPEESPQIAPTLWSALVSGRQALPTSGSFFLEIFAGKAGITDAVRLLGVQVLPPVDIVCSQHVLEPVDVLDVNTWDCILRVLRSGVVFFIHCGTPCNTFTSARKHDGGPPPLRSVAQPLGLPDLSAENRDLVFLGNLFLFKTIEACVIVFDLGGNFSIENPLLSLMWQTPQISKLTAHTRALALDFDQCAFGAASVKPTRLLCSSQLLDSVVVKCPGGHRHIKLKGKVWDPKVSRYVFKTKAAQVYPWALCATMALAIAQLHEDEFQHLAPSFALRTPAADRKRALGSGKVWGGHKQAETARKALHAGYQLKRGAAQPLLDIEMEPGESIAFALHLVHPFTVPVALPPALQTALSKLHRSPAAICDERTKLLHFWEARATALLPKSIELIRAQPDIALQRLLLGEVSHGQPQLGQVCHIALYAEMLQACASVDQQLPQLLLEGFPIVGPIAPSGRWAPYNKPQQVQPIQKALNRAWALRSKIVNRVQAVPVTENLQKIWEATIEDVSEGSCMGPFSSEEEVSKVLKADDWIPTQRFEVVQKNKVRGCDSATTNMINQITEIVEKLELPSTDSNVTALRMLRSMDEHAQLAGWVLDERKACRQVAIRPDHRKFSVICLKDPSDGQRKFFVMVGHSFGLVSAVYNYNRRSAAINEILVQVFGLVAFSFYDDKYGFETVDTIVSARHVAECVHFWLGAKFDKKKLQLSRAPTILGVTYNLELMQLEIKKERKQELSDEITSVLHSGLLDPGSAGKLKGKLMFGASQLWGKVGRAFLRVISERQYMRFPNSSTFKLDKPLEMSLHHWHKLVNEGPPRPIDQFGPKLVDAVIFTDGFTPDPRSNDVTPDRVGAVLFDRRLKCPLQFTSLIPDHVKKRWLSRTTQIVPVEMIAPVLALATFADRLQGADVLLLIDSESVEGALIKGYSSREDLCEIISVFWDLALQLRVRVFIDRISTDANPADWPSRDRLTLGENAGWKTVKPVWPEALLKGSSVSGPGH